MIIFNRADLVHRSSRGCDITERSITKPSALSALPGCRIVFDCDTFWAGIEAGGKGKGNRMHGTFSADPTEMVMFSTSNIEECIRFVTSMAEGDAGWAADIEFNQGKYVAILTRTNPRPSIFAAALRSRPYRVSTFQLMENFSCPDRSGSKPLFGQARP
jgi:hypothetical protein